MFYHQLATDNPVMSSTISTSYFQQNIISIEARVSELNPVLKKLNELKIKIYNPAPEGSEALILLPAKDSVTLLTILTELSKENASFGVSYKELTSFLTKLVEENILTHEQQEQYAKSIHSIYSANDYEKKIQLLLKHGQPHAAAETAVEFSKYLYNSMRLENDYSQAIYWLIYAKTLNSEVNLKENGIENMIRQTCISNRGFLPIEDFFGYSEESIQQNLKCLEILGQYLSTAFPELCSVSISEGSSYCRLYAKTPLSSLTRHCPQITTLRIGEPIIGPGSLRNSETQNSCRVLDCLPQSNIKTLNVQFINHVVLENNQYSDGTEKYFVDAIRQSRTELTTIEVASDQNGFYCRHVPIATKDLNKIDLQPGQRPQQISKTS